MFEVTKLLIATCKERAKNETLIVEYTNVL